MADLETGERVEDIMHPSNITTTRNAVLNEALSLMLTSGVQTLPVVDKDDKLEGVLSFEAIQAALQQAARKESSE